MGIENVKDECDVLIWIFTGNAGETKADQDMRLVLVFCLFGGILCKYGYRTNKRWNKNIECRYSNYICRHEISS